MAKPPPLAKNDAPRDAQVEIVALILRSQIAGVPITEPGSMVVTFNETDLEINCAELAQAAIAAMNSASITTCFECSGPLNGPYCPKCNPAPNVEAMILAERGACADLMASRARAQLGHLHEAEDERQHDRRLLIVETYDEAEAAIRARTQP